MGTRLLQLYRLSLLSVGKALRSFCVTLALPCWDKIQFNHRPSFPALYCTMYAERSKVCLMMNTKQMHVLCVLVKQVKLAKPVHNIIKM